LTVVVITGTGCAPALAGSAAFETWNAERHTIAATSSTAAAAINNNRLRLIFSISGEFLLSARDL
jgi:hypothetical protein